MVTTKPKSTFTCSSCKANHVQWMGRCHFCKSWNTITEVVPKSTKSDLDIFFEFAREHALENNLCKCENCGKSIRSQLNSKDTWVWRASIAHCLPKKTFISISTHVHNYMILCMSCHGQYDSSWLNAQKMPCFAIAKKKYQLFKNLITESKTKIEKYFE
jgi:hypothetical protein